MEMNENSVELQEEAVPASAEGESVEESVEEISEAVGEEAAEAEQPPEEENIPDHVWERARKVAEARYNQKLERINNAFKSRFYNEFGVTTAEQYIEKLDEQRRAIVEEQIKRANLDPGLLNAIVEQNPLVKNANEVANRISAMLEAQEGQRAIQDQIDKISKIDPSVKSLKDIYEMDSFAKFDRLVRSGVSLVDAFKTANYDKLIARNGEAAKQAAINAAKGKQHMTQTKGNAGNGVSMSEEDLQVWKAFGFDEKSAKKHHAKYAKK